MTEHRPSDDEIKKQLIEWLTRWHPDTWWQKLLKMWLIQQLTD